MAKHRQAFDLTICKMMGKMARSRRFELLTPRFVVWCSIQLSYERVGLVLENF
jgi:hypothetical protein